MNRSIGTAVRTVAVLAGLAFATGTALAHPGEHGGTGVDTGLLGVVLFAVGLGVVGVNAAAARAGAVESRHADVGVTLGLLTVAAGAFVFWY